MTVSSLEHSARVASRWLWISASLDVLPVLAAVVVGLAMMKAGASPAFFVLLFVIGSGVAAIMVANALWKFRAGQRIRQGVQDQDGDLFASAFVPLRRVFVLSFISYTFSTLVLLVSGV